MAFLSSNKIKVFPTAFRGQDASGHAIDPGSFLTTEENFVNIANKITYLHKDYFYVDGNTAHIILGGYYFVASVSDIQALFSSPANGDEIWACINVADFGSAYESTSVKTLTPNGGSAGGTLDDSTNFKGLTFLGKNDSKDGFTYKLKLFKRVSNAWVVEESSQLNISTNQIENGNSSTPITKSFSTNTLSASSISASSISANSISASFIATNELVAYSNGIITQSIFGPSQMVIGTSGTLSLYASSIYTQGDILPYANDVYNLGSISSRFQSLYVNEIINPGDISITANTNIVGGIGGVLDLNAGNYISLNGSTNTHSIYPNATNTYTLGNSSKYYKSAYITNAYLSSIYGSGTNNSLLLSAGNTNLSTSGFTVNATDIRLQAGNTSGQSLWFVMNSSNASAMINASYFRFYMYTSSITLGLDTLGGPSRPIYLSNGVITPCNANVGKKHTPVYLSNGIITSCNSTGHITINDVDISGEHGKTNPINITDYARWKNGNDNILNFVIYQRHGNVVTLSITSYQVPNEDKWLRYDLGSILYNCGLIANTAQIDTMDANSLGCVVTARKDWTELYNPKFVYFHDTSSTYKRYLYIAKDEAGDHCVGFTFQVTMYLDQN